MSRRCASQTASRARPSSRVGIDAEQPLDDNATERSYSQFLRVSAGMVRPCCCRVAADQRSPGSANMLTAAINQPFPMVPLCNALTVDVEDYYHVSAFEPYIDRSRWEQFESRVVPNTRRILGLLEKHRLQATFFVLGWVAERFPQLVREISQQGHELGCHSYAHRLVYQMTPEAFRADLHRARSVIQEAAGVPVVSYRAPSFSITKQSLWALDILAEEGFRFDSSIFPIYHDRYGIPDAQPEIHRRDTPFGPLWEFPPSVVQLGPLNLPVSGGGYFRLYPLWWTTRLLRRINQRYGRPFVFYMHPWELDPEQPRLKVASRLSQFRHYVNLASNERKLEILLGRFAFAPMTQVIEAAVRPDSQPSAASLSRTIPGD